MSSPSSSAAAAAALLNKNKGPRACTTCAKAKARCIPSPTPDICERCHRLNKPCSQQTPAPPRKRKEPKPTRVAELERRLGALTARLDAAATGSGEQGRTPPDSLPGNSPQDDLCGGGGCGEDCTPDGGSGLATPGRGDPNEMPDWWDQQKSGTVALATRQPPTMPFRIGHLFPSDAHDAALTPPSSDRARATSWDGTVDGDDRSADGSRRSQGPRDGSTPGSVFSGRRERIASITDRAQSQPLEFLFPTSNNNCQISKTLPGPLWPEPEEAAALLNEYRTHLAPVFPFVALPPNLAAADLRSKRPFVWKAVMMAACRLDGPRQIVLGNTLLREIMGAAFLRPQKGLDLLQGLLLLVAWFHYNVNSFQMTNLLFLMRSLCTGMGLIEGIAEDAPKAKRHSLEQLRTFVGAYYLITLTFTTNKKLDALISTPYLDVACDALSARMEYPGDELAVYLVRIQQLAQSIFVAMAPRKEHGFSEMPLAMVLKSYQEQIDNYRDSLPENLQDNVTIIQHTHVAEILLYDIGALDSHPIYFFTPTERLELLWSCLRAARGFLAMRFPTDAADIESYATEPVFLTLGSFEFLFALLTTFKLIMLTSMPGWDTARAQREVDIELTMERLVQSMKAVAIKRSTRRRYAPGEVPGLAQDPFDRLAKRVIELGTCLFRAVMCKQSVPASVLATVGPQIPGSTEQAVAEEQQKQQRQQSLTLASQAQQFQAFGQFPSQQIQFQQEMPAQFPQQQQQQQAVQGMPHQQQQVQEVENEAPTPAHLDPQNLFPGDVDTLMQDFDTNSWPELMTEWEPYFTQANFEDFSNPNL